MFCGPFRQLLSFISHYQLSPPFSTHTLHKSFPPIMEGSYEERKKTTTTSTRLQKRAPAPLQLHGITTGVSSSFEAGWAIPLLSPLLFSPPQLVVAAGKGKELAAAEPGGSGWKHPALGGMMNEPSPSPSKLGARFQLQCMLTDNL